MADVSPAPNNKKLIQEAIQIGRESLKHLSPVTLPEQWAMCQNDLGASLIALAMLSDGDESTKAFADSRLALNAALTVRTREKDVYDWASSERNLALSLRLQAAYTSARELGIEQLSEAASLLKTILSTYPTNAAPAELADTMQAFATVLRLQAERATKTESKLALLNEAIFYQKKTIDLWPKDLAPRAWAEATEGLAGCLIALSKVVKRDEGLSLAHEAENLLNSVLSIYDRESFPQQWALAQNNLAVAFGMQAVTCSCDEWLQLLDRSVEAYREALSVYTLPSNPKMFKAIQENLKLIELQRASGRN